MKSDSDFFPVRECFMLAVGGLNVDPVSFWDLGMTEIYAVMDAKVKYQGNSTVCNAPTKEELSEMIRKLA